MRTSYAVAIATFFMSSSAFAQVITYGRSGTFEVGGTFVLNNKTSDYDETGKTERSEMTIRPIGGFYIMDSVEVLADVTVSNYEINDTEGSTLGVGVGAGYFMAIGTLRVGPQILFRYYSDEFGTGQNKATETGPGATAGVAGKVPIGSGGLVIAALNYDYITTTRKQGSFKEDGSVSGYQVEVGFGIYF